LIHLTKFSSYTHCHHLFHSHTHLRVRLRSPYPRYNCHYHHNRLHYLFFGIVALQTLTPLLYIGSGDETVPVEVGAVLEHKRKQRHLRCSPSAYAPPVVYLPVPFLPQPHEDFERADDPFHVRTELWLTDAHVQNPFDRSGI
uniref:Secreted protein n=1 Tax=Rodentolepis nana TaxID=102285 RepID=A0A0R3TLB4_RODNA